MEIIVVNKRDKQIYPNTIYIGRGSVLGNRFIIGKDGTRKEVISKYSVWLSKELQKKKEVWNEIQKILRAARKYKKVHLECFCKPMPCHGDIIVKMLMNIDNII